MHAMRLLFRRLTGDFKVVFYAKDSGNAVGSDASNVLVGLRVDYAVKLHMAVLHRDADRFFGIDGVPVQRRVAVHGARHREPDAVIHRRNRIDLNFVDHVFDTGRCRGDGQSGVAIGIVVGMTAQRNDAVLNLIEMASNILP